MAKLILQNQTEPASPDAGCTTLYVDCDDGKIKAKKSDGSIVDIITSSTSQYNNPILCGCVSEGGIGLKWSDPIKNYSCINILPEMQERWDCSYVVRKNGSLPNNINDGDILCIECCKNKYCSSYFIDTTSCVLNSYGYRIFSKTKMGDYLYSDGYFAVNFPPIRYLVIGGGGPGTSSSYGIGGGAGGVKSCDCYCLENSSYQITIGQGGVHGNCYCTPGSAGGDTTFGNIIAIGGNTNGCGVSGDGNTPGSSAHPTGGGGAGAGGNGGNGEGCSGRCCGGKGGKGICSDIEGTLKCYAGGGGGGGYGGSLGGCDGGGTTGGNPTTYGSGGGGAGQSANNSTNGYQGVVIISYPVGEGYNVTGGNCCYECNGQCIHIFTSDGTLCFNSL